MTRRAEPDARPDGVVALRVPLLPYDRFGSWSEGLEAESAAPDELPLALERDRKTLRDRLADAFTRPEVREALFLASPKLEGRLDDWLQDPHAADVKVERALVRYFARMCSRPTPFGLFASAGTGGIGEVARLEIGDVDSIRKKTRLDMHYLTALAEALARDAALRRELNYRPNSSLYRAGGRLRYAHADLSGASRTYRLIAVEETDYLRSLLDAARGGASFDDLARLLAIDGVTMEEAVAFVERLIDAQILVADLEPPVTGEGSLETVVDSLRHTQAGGDAATHLARVAAALADLDRKDPGAPASDYRAIAAGLPELPIDVDIGRLFQVDAVRFAAATVPPAVVDEALRVTETLARIGGGPRRDPMDSFRRAFVTRFEAAEIPLMEALDEEIGVGFEASTAPAAEAAPLLKNVPLPSLAPEGPPWTERDAFLLDRVSRAIANGSNEWALTSADVSKLEVEEVRPLPDAFSAMVAIAAPRSEDVAAGRFKLLVSGAAGPSGARLLARFCHADPDLRGAVEEHIRREEALRPDAIFAEIVHLPEGRIGNVLARPAFRGYEIPFLGRSSADDEHQIPVTDLMVSVVGERVVLRSKRLDKEVIPRLSSAHNYGFRSLGVYRFLCSLQDHACASGVGWSWGPLEDAAFLPRVVIGRSVVSRARWLLGRDELAELERHERDPFAAMHSLRRRRRLPRRVVLADVDNALLLDLDNVLSVESFVQIVKRRGRARLVEMWPGPDELLATGSEGRYAHELVIPFTKATATKARMRKRSGAPDGFCRSFPPGSGWAYVKVYTGTASADAVLRDAGQTLLDLSAQGAIDRWFFLRFADPAWHLRFRLSGDPEMLRGKALPALSAALESHRHDGRLWKVELDTYEREVERYGGPAAIELSEEIFHADSETVHAILLQLPGDAGMDLRWRIAFAGVDVLFDDFALDIDARVICVERMLTAFRQEFRAGPEVKRAIGQRYRNEKTALASLIDGDGRSVSPIAPFVPLLAKRSELVAPVAQRLAELEREGRLDGSLRDVIASFCHMHVNRTLRSAHRAHELVLYDLLQRAYRARLATGRAGKQATR